MSKFAMSGHRPSFLAAILVPVLALLLACGPREEPTPVPTPTQPPIVATPTPTPPPLVATPTPTAVATPTRIPAAGPQRGGTLKWVDQRYTSNFEAYTSPGQTLGNRWHAKLYNNLLVNYGGPETVECELCSEWHLENNGKAMVFTLIPGIRFQTSNDSPYAGSDGRELTAADVKYSLRMIMGEVDGIASPRTGVIKEYIESIETPSKYEVRINLFRPSLYMNQALALQANVIIPEGTTREAMMSKYYGTGPFALKRMVSGASWTLERSPNYFKEGQPYIDKFEITTAAEVATQMAAVMTGASDYWAHGPGAPPPQYRPQLYKLAEEGKLVILKQPLYPTAHGFSFNTAKPPFDNVKVRQAVNLALDRKVAGAIQHGDVAIVHLLRQAEGMFYGQLDSEVWDVKPGWGTGAKKQQEIEQAKQLIKAEYPNGLKVTMVVPTPINPWDLAYQQMLGDVGIEAPFRSVTGGTQAALMTEGDYNFISRGLSIITDDPDEVIGVYFITGASRNQFGYSNHDVDQLYLKMSSELDPVKRKGLFHQIRDIILFTDVVWATTMGSPTIPVFQPRMQGYVQSTDGVLWISIPHGASGFERADRLWLKQ